MATNVCLSPKYSYVALPSLFIVTHLKICYLFSQVKPTFSSFIDYSSLPLHGARREDERTRRQICRGYYSIAQDPEYFLPFMASILNFRTALSLQTTNLAPLYTSNLFGLDTRAVSSCFSTCPGMLICIVKTHITFPL